MGEDILKRKDILYPDLSYKIIGCAFDVYNSLGSGHSEKYYQKALCEALSSQTCYFDKLWGTWSYFQKNNQSVIYQRITNQIRINEYLYIRNVFVIR